MATTTRQQRADIVAKHVRSGKIHPSQAHAMLDYATGLNDDDFNTFNDLHEQMPASFPAFPSSEYMGNRYANACATGAMAQDFAADSTGWAESAVDRQIREGKLHPQQRADAVAYVRGTNSRQFSAWQDLMRAAPVTHMSQEIIDADYRKRAEKFGPMKPQPEPEVHFDVEPRMSEADRSAELMRLRAQYCPSSALAMPAVGRGEVCFESAEVVAQFDAVDQATLQLPGGTMERTGETDGVPWIERWCKLFSGGVQKGTDYTDDRLDRIVQNFEAKQKPANDREWRVPVQLGHPKPGQAPDAARTVGNLRDVIRRGHDLYGRIRAIGKAAVENVRGGLWNRVSVGLRGADGLTIHHVAVTPDPHVVDAQFFEAGHAPEQSGSNAARRALVAKFGPVKPWTGDWK